MLAWKQEIDQQNQGLMSPGIEEKSLPNRTRDFVAGLAAKIGPSRNRPLDFTSDQSGYVAARPRSFSMPGDRAPILPEFSFNPRMSNAGGLQDQQRPPITPSTPQNPFDSNEDPERLRLNTNFGGNPFMDPPVAAGFGAPPEQYRRVPPQVHTSPHHRRVQSARLSQYNTFNGQQAPPYRNPFADASSPPEDYALPSFPPPAISAADTPRHSAQYSEAVDTPASDQASIYYLPLSNSTSETPSRDHSRDNSSNSFTIPRKPSNANHARNFSTSSNVQAPVPRRPSNASHSRNFSRTMSNHTRTFSQTSQNSNQSPSRTNTPGAAITPGPPTGRSWARTPSIGRMPSRNTRGKSDPFDLDRPEILQMRYQTPVPTPAPHEVAAQDFGNRGTPTPRPILKKPE
jgi:hypothetical protein